MFHRYLRMAALSLVAVTGMAVLPAVAQSASAGETPGSYVDYDFGGPTTGFSQDQRLDVGPGNANVYWSTQFGLTKSAGGYIGMQTGKNGEGLFLMSIWDSTGGIPGPGSKCIQFAEDGSGQSCRIVGLSPEEGHTYTTSLSVAPDGRITGAIDDATTGERHLLGSVKTPEGNRIKSGIGSWTEYFDWNSDDSHCADEAYSKMTTSHPVSADGSTARRTSVSPSTTCAADTRLTENPTDTVQENGIGNSPGGHVVDSTGKCLDVQDGAGNGAKVDLWSSCHGGANQNWVHAADGSLRSQYRCLDANGTKAESAVTMWSCNGGSNQRWTVVDGGLRNARSGLCASSSLSAGSPAAPGLTLQGCASATRFTVPASTTPTPPPAADDAVLRTDTGCLDLLGHLTANGSAVALWSCNDGENQRWTAGEDGTRRTLAVCLDANGTTARSAVTVWTCNGGANQRWERTADGMLRNDRSGLCLTATSSGSRLDECAIATRWA